MRLRSTFILLLLSATIALNAGNVSQQTARQAGLKFYSERAGLHHVKGSQNYTISGTCVIRNEDVPLYYLFNINDEGFIAVSASDAVIPVLAYSFEGIYEEGKMAPPFNAWMDQYSRQIAFAIRNNALPTPKAASEWSRLLNTDPVARPENILDVEPMITSNWNQPYPYNEMCPADPGGSIGHAIVGCVPVAMGQLMYYYRWPDHGTGSYTYTSTLYGDLSADFENTWYRWNNMKNMTTKSDTGIAQLLFHLGVSVDLVYGPTSSGMYNHKAAYALRTYFKYSPQTQYLFRDSTNLKWDSVILAHLDRKMPLYYAGWSVPNINGHAFVCDGYQGTDYFHFNFGWAGSSNGYFYLDNITPGGNNFNLAQELIINMYPDTVNYTYPAYCAGSMTAKYNQGSLADGSGPVKDYQGGADCRWLIDPQTQTDSVSRITIDFDRFETASGDLVNCYDGTTTASTLLGSFSGSALPSSVSSTGNKMLVTFQSQSGSEAPGWSLNYSTTAPVWCTGQKNITLDTAVITDGSLGFNYNNNSICKWLITPASGKIPFTIYFRKFDTEPGKDFLTILDPDTQHTLISLSGHYNSGTLPDSVTSPSGKMLVLFTSNSYITAGGFEFYYPRSTEGIASHSSPNGISIYPNPVSGKLFVEMESSQKQKITVDVLSMDGITRTQSTFNLNPGGNKLTMDLTGLPSGIYLLRVTGGSWTEVRKVVVN